MNTNNKQAEKEYDIHGVSSSINALLSKFDNGLELYQNNAVFANCIEHLLIGGEFTMNKHTPIWVANYGNSGNTAVIDVVDNDYCIILITGYREF